MRDDVRFFAIPMGVGVLTAAALIVVLVHYRPESASEAIVTRDMVLKEQINTQQMIEQNKLRHERTWAKLDSLLDWSGVRATNP